MEKVTLILKRKESHFRYISPLSSADEALCRMNCEGTDYLVVMDDDGHYVGVVTEHDIATKLMLESKSLSRTPVRHVANRELPIASVDDTVEQCLRRMRQYNVKLLPVFEGNNFVGMVTSDDILEELVSLRADIFDEDETPLVY